MTTTELDVDVICALADRLRPLICTQMRAHAATLSQIRAPTPVPTAREHDETTRLLTLACSQRDAVAQQLAVLRERFDSATQENEQLRQRISALAASHAAAMASAMASLTSTTALMASESVAPDIQASPFVEPSVSSPVPPLEPTRQSSPLPAVRGARPAPRMVSRRCVLRRAATARQRAQRQQRRNRVVARWNY